MPQTSAYDGQVNLALADRTALLGATTQPTCQVSITDVSYDFEARATGRVVRQVTVAGLAWGAPKVDVALEAPGWSAPLAQQANVGSGLGWSRSFSLTAPGLPVGTRVRLRVATLPGNACTASASESIVLGEPNDLVVADPASSPAGFEQGRNPFVAGYADRLVRTRFFVPLVWAHLAPPKAHQIAMARAMSKLGVTRRQAYRAVASFVQALRSAGRKAMAGVKGGPMGSARVRRLVIDAIADASQSLAGPAGKRGLGRRKGAKTRRAPRASRVNVSETEMAGGLEVGVVAPGGLADKPVDAKTAFAGYQATLGSVGGQLIGVGQGFEKYALSGWLGILFYDRLRFRPSGLVAGEQVYSLALAPAEEVTLTQRSETKRSRSFEDVLDRTTERELEFSSTFSTDVSQQDTLSQTSTVGGNLGVSATVPIEGVEVGVTEGVNAQDSNTIGSTFQRDRSSQLTSRFAAKSREQHKTTFKVSTDLTEEFGSKRVLRNPNPSRALTLNFHKLYQKHRVILERYDAKLAIGFCLDDPGRDLRAEIEEEFAKLDPKLAAGACPEIPQGGTAKSEHVIANADAEEWGGDEFGHQRFSTALPPHTVLSDWKFEIVDWVIDDDGTERKRDPANFEAKGGDWKFWSAADVPEVGKGGNISSDVWVLMPEAWGPGWWTKNVTGRMTWSYVASDAITAQVQACIDEEKNRIRDSFSADRVAQILEEVKAGGQSLVYQRLFKTVLLRDYYAMGMNPPCELLERVRNFFDWNEAAVEYLPWWMTPGGELRREKLRQLLLSLPGDTRSDVLIDDALVASAARIYLPIRPGLEEEAVVFLTGESSLQASGLGGYVGDFVDWRQANLGPVSYPLPTYAQVLDVGPGHSTAAGDPAWQHDWERPRRKFVVLDEWSETLPTDGVHVEPGLSTGGSVDEYRASALRSDLASAAAMREVEGARAALEEGLASRPAPATTVVIGDPLVKTP